MIPLKDSLLVPYSTNFNTRINATPAVFGLLPPQGLQYTTLHTVYVNAYQAMMNARADGTRSESLTAAKDAVKTALLKYARELYAFVQANTTVSDANKILLGIHVRATPSPIPAPTTSPDIDIVSTTGRTVKIRLHDSTVVGRGRPAGVEGAAIFSYVGATPPADTADWKFEMNTSKVTEDIVFPADVANGALVWFTAFWIGSRMESGPACTPVSTNIPGGMTMAA